MKLDESAEELYRLLGGMETAKIITSDSALPDQFLENLAEEERGIDQRRMAIIEAAAHVAGYLDTSRAGLSPAKRTSAFEGAMSALASLENGGQLMIRYRGGSPGGDNVDDYVVTGGNLPVDHGSAKGMVRRMGARASHVPGRLMAAVKTLADMRIHTLRIDPADSGVEQVRAALTALGAFYHALGAAEKSATLIRDENGHPDPNLNVLMALSRFDSATFQNLVGKVAALLAQSGDNQAMGRYVNVYEALFDIKQVKDGLVKPAIEVNDVRWLMYRPQQRTHYGTESVKIARAALGAYRDAPWQIGAALASLDSESYRQLTAQVFESKLLAAGDLLLRLGKSELRHEALARIKDGLETVPEEALESVSIVNGRMCLQQDRQTVIADTTDGVLSAAVSFFQRRAATKRKIRQMTRKVVTLTDEDIETLAADLNVEKPVAREICERLQACFTTSGRFVRRAFEESVPAFAPHGVKIFEFLRRFMDDLPQRDDRVALLNAMQNLIGKITDRRGALRSLLEDFASYTEGIRFSDRNTLLLASIMLRSYNKEMSANIEVTPEEVLLVRKGLDPDALAWVREAIDDDSDRLLEKTRSLHGELLKRLEGGESGEQPLRFLVTTMREYYIFMALCGSEVSSKVVRFAFGEMANPSARIYSLAHDKGHMKSLFQLLQVSLRGLLRFIAPGDLPILQKFLAAAGDFEKMHMAYIPEGSLAKVMGYADDGIRACETN
jgi:hypothetical protein